MSLDKLPVQIEVDKACDRFIDECRKNGNKVVTTELTRLVKHTSFLVTEDARSTAIERFEARMDAMEKSQSQTRWFIGIGLTLMTIVVSIVIAVTSRQPQPTQNQQPVQQQQVQPQVQQPVQPQQTVEPAEQNGQTVLP